MSRGRGSVRIGPVSLLTLLIVLCLAVMAVLAVTTAQATYAVTSRQASFTKDTYANEAAAQRFVATLDEVLQDQRSAGAARNDVMQTLNRNLPRMLEESSDGATSASATIDGNIVSASFVTESGRVLNVELVVKANLAYEIGQWKTAPPADKGASETLWTGPEQKD